MCQLSNQMKIVHIEDFFLPSSGYQINLLSKLQVQHGHDVTIVASQLDKVPTHYTSFFGKDPAKDRKFTEQTGVKIVRVPILAFYSGRSIYYPSIFKIVDALKPDVLFIHGEDTLIGMQYIRRYHKLTYPLILDCHMVEVASINRFRKLFRLFFRNFIASIIIKNDIPLIRVVDVDYLEKCLGIPLEKTTYLPLGTDTELFKPDSEARRKFRAAHGIDEDAFVVMYAGKLDKFKKGLFLAEAIKEPFRTRSGKGLVFLIVGNTESDYGNRVEALFSQSVNRIIRLPTQDYIDLAPFYQAADLAVFPAQCSLSFYDVQACGIPVLLERIELNEQRTQHGNGFTFNPGDVGDFRSKILYCADMPERDWGKMRTNSQEYVLEGFNFPPIAAKITEIMAHEVRRFHDRKNTS